MSIDNNNSSTSARNIECAYSNKYERWYWSLVEKFNQREDYPYLYEEHHPIPKEIWPEGWDSGDTKWVVKVSHREHFILHLLLTKNNFSYSSLNRFLKNFSRGKQKGLKATNLKPFWDKYQFKGDNLPNRPWEHTYRKDLSFLELWRDADYFHYVWDNLLAKPKKMGSGYSGNGYRNLAKATGVEANKTMRRMVNYFRSGWIPWEDEGWVKFTQS